MTTATMIASRIDAPRAPREVMYEWREGLLQDLVAVSFLVRTLRERLGGDGASAELLDVVSGTLASDLELMRDAIKEIEAAANA